MNPDAGARFPYDGGLEVDAVHVRAALPAVLQAVKVNGAQGTLLTLAAGAGRDTR